jgi:serine/threonine protein phosphatase PrpC
MLQFVLAPSDRIALCSDGLWDEVPPERIGLSLGQAIDPQSCAAELVAIANASGGHDNSTAVVIFVDAEAGDAPFEGAEPESMLADASGGPHSESVGEQVSEGEGVDAGAGW